MLLELEKVTAGYGRAPVIQNIFLTVNVGEIVCVIGPNGAGKSTVLKTVAGRLKPYEGTVKFHGHDLSGKSIAERGRRGLVYIPQGMNIFPNLTVVENLEIEGQLLKERKTIKQAVNDILMRYPFLEKKKKSFGRELSGGERQILALCRSRILKPKLVLLDEPSLGLAPLMVEQIFNEIAEVVLSGSSVLLVEQNARKGLASSHRGYVLELGRNRLTGTGKELLENDEVRRLYLGG